MTKLEIIFVKHYLFAQKVQNVQERGIEKRQISERIAQGREK